MKRGIVALALLALVVVGVNTQTGETSAATTVMSSISTNIVAVGNVEMEIQEYSEYIAADPTSAAAFEDVEGVMPGDTWGKTVFVENTGTEDLYARVSVTVKVVYEVEGEESLVTIDYDTQDYMALDDINATTWTYYDGYYYYNEAIEPGEASAEPLFTEVAFLPGLSALYDDDAIAIQIVLQGQAVQASNNSPAENLNGDTTELGEAVLNAVDVVGWPETDSTQEVT